MFKLVRITTNKAPELSKHLDSAILFENSTPEPQLSSGDSVYVALINNKPL